MFLVSGAVAVTGEFFFTAIAVCFICSTGAALFAMGTLTRRFCQDYWRAALLLLVLLSSKAFIDYASSGLENSLSYLLSALFVMTFFALPQKRANARQLFLPVFISALAYVNRVDLLMLFIPGLIYMMIKYRSAGLRKWILILLIGTLPATCWTFFSLIYYGFPFPNTAYAKAFAIGFPASWKLQRGIEYLARSFRWDFVSFVLYGAALTLSLKNRAWKSVFILLGIALYSLFIVVSAASATHMGGRFFAVPFFISGLVFCRELNSRYGAMILGVILVAFLIWWPVSPFKYGTAFYHPGDQVHYAIDTKWYVYNEGAALLNWRPGVKMPDHNWYRYGQELRQQGEQIQVGGTDHGDAIGYTGFAAGPDVFIIDTVALSDPLLARLPAVLPEALADWKSGHIYRDVPDGYIESIQDDTNRIKNPDIHALYERIYRITRDPLFSAQRLQDILDMNIEFIQSQLLGQDDSPAS
jgi:arabinofuranosyltransferase